MTLAEAKRIEKQLSKAWIIAQNSRRASNVLAAIEATQTILRKVQQIETCPSCKEILRSWHDHKENCELA